MGQRIYMNDFSTLHAHYRKLNQGGHLKSCTKHGRSNQSLRKEIVALRLLLSESDSHRYLKARHLSVFPIDYTVLYCVTFNMLNSNFDQTRNYFQKAPVGIICSLTNQTITFLANLFIFFCSMSILRHFWLIPYYPYMTVAPEITLFRDFSYQIWWPQDICKQFDHFLNP